jgi:hypothetical protein
MAKQRKAHTDENSLVVIMIMLIIVFGPVTIAHMLALATE